MKMRQEIYKKILEGVDDGIYFLDTERRITYWNKGAERLSGYTAREVVGLHCSDHILVHTDKEGAELCTSACPVSAAIIDGQTHEAEVFMHHKDGYRVPVTVNVSPVRDAQGKTVGAIEIFRETKSDTSDRLVMEDLKKMALIDPLTELPNRRSFEMRLKSSFAELRRHGIPFGIIFCDIDHFKNFNDTYGHKVGDDVLKMVSKTFRVNLRLNDFVGRWGGEEFVMLVTHTKPKRLLEVAEKLRVLVGNSFLGHNGGQLRVTVTMGCTAAAADDTSESIIKRVDSLLYKGKKEGRNRVVSDFGKLAA